ncbi:ester cyclase [Streptomyces sp. NPDC055607]
MTTGLKDAYRRFIEVGWNQADHATIDELVAQDYLGHDPLATLQGREALKDYLTAFRTAFPDHVLSIQDEIAESDRTVHRWRADGTHTGPFLHLEPTGLPFVITGITIARWHHGQIQEAWFQYDLHGILSQLTEPPAQQVPAEARV